MNKVFKSATLCFLLLFTLPLSAETPDEAKIKKTVIAYNFGIIESVRKQGSTEHLKNLVDAKELQKLMLWVKAWQDDNQVMDAKIEDLLVKNIEMGKEGTAKAYTDEKWIYRYVNMESKEIDYPPVKIFYSMEYSLTKTDHGWIIEKTKILHKEETPLEEKKSDLNASV